jgi:hypothetical protein
LDPHIWPLYDRQYIEDELAFRHFLLDEKDIEPEWISMHWEKQTRQSLPDFNESEEALSIDDSQDRGEIANLIGLKSAPPRNDSNINSLIGIFDSIVDSHEEVDVTEWVKSIRKRST